MIGRRLLIWNERFESSRLLIAIANVNGILSTCADEQKWHCDIYPLYTQIEGGTSKSCFGHEPTMVARPVKLRRLPFLVVDADTEAGARNVAPDETPIDHFGWLLR
jgi:hypothetical protein